MTATVTEKIRFKRRRDASGGVFQTIVRAVARDEIACLGVAGAMDQAHVFSRDILMEPGLTEVCSATIQHGGKITKSTFTVPAVSDGDVSAVNVDGSG